VTIFVAHGPAAARRRIVQTIVTAAVAVLATAAPVRGQERIDLVWHAETLSGKAVMSKAPDRLVNPASVVKVASTFRALQLLGPSHRFDTTFAATGGGARRDGVLAGDLVVVGGKDPDFHFENALLVARELNRLGIREVAGDLVVDRNFWIGWERGAAGREAEPDRRAHAMAQRLLDALNPEKWSEENKQAWADAAQRRSWPPASPPSIVFRGGIRLQAAPERTPLLTHRSEPLSTALHRFNVFSNNDIERLDATVGGPGDLAAFLTKRWGQAAAGIRFETTSGLNSNRMSGRQIVRLVRELHQLLQQHGLQLGDVLPVMGCGDSTLRHLFPRLREDGSADGMVGKTGTLNTTDGGVSALAGMLPASEPVLFFVAAPGAGHALARARAAEEDWVGRLIKQRGPLQPARCPAEVKTSDLHAQVVPAAPAQPASAP